MRSECLLDICRPGSTGCDDILQLVWQSHTMQLCCHLHHASHSWAATFDHMNVKSHLPVHNTLGMWRQVRGFLTKPEVPKIAADLRLWIFCKRSAQGQLNAELVRAEVASQNIHVLYCRRIWQACL